MFVKGLVILLFMGEINQAQGLIECESHPQCLQEGLSGNCCPDDFGVWNACCFQAECDVIPACFLAGKDGYCCPDTDGIYDPCCSVDPSPFPTVETPSPSASHSPTMIAACSAHPKCAHLDDDCCPNKQGEMLCKYHLRD